MPCEMCPDIRRAVPIRLVSRDGGMCVVPVCSGRNTFGCVVVRAGLELTCSTGVRSAVTVDATETAGARCSSQSQSEKNADTASAYRGPRAAAAGTVGARSYPMHRLVVSARVVGARVIDGLRAHAGAERVEP